MSAQHVPDEALWALASGEPGVPADAAHHVGGCAGCQARLAQLRAARTIARRARLPDPGPGSQARALQRLEQALEQENFRQRAWWDRRPLVLPALGLSALAGAAAVLLLGSPQVPQGDWPAPAVATARDVSAPAVPRAPAPPAITVTAEAPVVAQAVSRPVAPPARPRPRHAPAAAPAVAMLPAGAAPAVAPVAAPEAMEFQQVVQVARFPRVAAARDQLTRGKALEAARLALQLLASDSADERAEAADLLNAAAFTDSSAPMFNVLDEAIARSAPHREALGYVGCQAAVLGRNAPLGVRRCRAFARDFPDSPRARDASYVAGTLSRDELHDCRGAIDDYTKALVFTGPLLRSLNDDAQFWRASCYAELGQREQARVDLDQFLARNPARRVDPKVRALLEQVRAR